MPVSFPLSPDYLDKSPNAVDEVIFRLKIQDAMSSDLTTAGREAPLREVQQLMKTRQISGVPIVDDGRLLGIVTVHDIINALDYGYIDARTGDYMSKSLVVLEDDMPLSFAISYFNKYSYRRFPVINRDKRLVGMISSRDILAALINELNQEIQDLEQRVKSEKVSLPNQIRKEFYLQKFDFENAGHPSFMLKKLLKEKGVDRKTIRRASVASYELEINVAIHTHGGKITFLLDETKITIIARDFGPGIHNTDQVMEEGYSTANEWIRSLGFGAGMGIPNARRVSDEFFIESEPGKGTMVRSVIYLENKEGEKAHDNQGNG